MPLPSSLRRRIATVLLCTGVAAAVVSPGLPGAEQTAEASAVPPPAGWVDHLNRMRADYGSAPLAVDSGLSAGAQQHALYMARNKTMQRHQDPARAGHTPAGQAAARNSLLAGPSRSAEDTPAEFTDLWARGAYTKLAMLHPAAKRIGYGQSQIGSSHYAALDIRTGRSAAPSFGTWPKSWPAARRPVDMTTYTGGELPNPVAGCGAPSAGGWGLPVLVSYGPGPRPARVSASLSVDGRPVSVCVVSAERSRDPEAVARLDEAHSVVLVPRGPLLRAKTYTGSVTSSRGRAAIRFSVAPAAGSATTAPRPAATAPRLKIALQPQVMMVGQTSRVWVAAAPGETVRLYAFTSPSSTYRLVRTGVANGAGMVSWVVRPGANTRLYAAPGGGPSARNSPSIVLSVRR